jgi:WD40 repeat protein
MNVFTLSKTLEFNERTKGQWFSNNCEMVITGAPTRHPDSPIQKFNIWDTNTGTIVRTIDNILEQTRYNKNSFALNPSGTEFIGSSPTGSICWNTSTWDVTKWGFGNQELFYNRSGTHIFSETKVGNQHVVIIYDSITKIPFHSFQFDDELVQYRVLSPDSKKYIYCGSGFFPGVFQPNPATVTGLKVRSVEDGRLLHSMIDVTNVQIWRYTGIDVSNDGKRVLAGYDAEKDGEDGEYGYINIWDIDTGKSLLQIQTDINECPIFSPDGKLVVTGSYNGTINIWDAETLKLIKVLNNPENNWNYSKLTFNADGSKLIMAIPTRLQIWENKDWEAIKALDESMPSIPPVLVRETASYTGPSDVPSIYSKRNDYNQYLFNAPFAEELLLKQKRIDGGKRKIKIKRKTKKAKKSKKIKTKRR